MAVRTATESEFLRLRLLTIGMTLALCALLYMLWRIQVQRGSAYEKNVAQQSIRRVRLPARRGIIFDRQGRPLAENRPAYGLSIYLEELRKAGPWSRTVSNTWQTLDTVRDIVGVAPDIDRDDIRIHIRKRLPLPLMAWNDLQPESLARWAEQGGIRRGVDLRIDAQRVYPADTTAAHVLGYVGRAEIEQNPEEPFDYYLPEMVGRTGVEKQFNYLLRGEAGGYLVRVDVSGFRYEDPALNAMRKDPKAGNDLVLSIDLPLQKIAEKSLGGASGAIVILNVDNGDVLALASMPSFNPNHFAPSISSERWNAYIRNSERPMFNRATAGGYPPGSTFKPMVAIAALENHRVSPDAQYHCPGYYQLGNVRFNCWYKPGHGDLDLVHAIKQSCNVYFMKMGLECGYDFIYHMAQAAGFGRKTGIDLDYERAGLLPGDRWKRTYFHDSWRDGDTCNVSIGQGALMTTPLQMAVFTAAIANGGRIYKPRLALRVKSAEGATLQAFPVEIVNDLNWSPDTLRLVREGMRRVIMDPDGTGHRAYVKGVTAAGKTGTAEYGPKEEGRKRGWMIAFAPFEKPRYAIALVVDEAISGGLTAAPCMQRVLKGLFTDYLYPEGRG